MSQLSVRAMKREDIPFIVRYWTENTPEYFERMGVDQAKIGPPEAMRSTLEKLCETPDAEKDTFYSVWLVDGRPVGYSKLNLASEGMGQMHLHIWEPSMRGKGYGGQLFCLSALDFYSRIKLKSIVCEPKSTNPFPNRMLQKAGFPRIGTRVAASGSLSIICEIHTYQITPDIASRNLP